MSPQYAANLKRLLAASKQSAESIAKDVVVSRATIYNWREGKGGPSEAQAKKLADIFGVALGEFWLPDTPVQPSEHERLAQLERFVQDVGQLLEAVESPRVIFTQASEVEAVRREKVVDNRLEKAAAKRARRDGTNR